MSYGLENLDQNGERLLPGDKIVYQMGGKKPKLVLAEVVEATWYRPLRIKRTVTGRVKSEKVLKVQ